MNKKRYTVENSYSFTLRIDKDLEEKIVAAVKALRLSKQDVIRLSLSIGLEKLARVNYNLPAAVLAAAESRSR